MDNIKRFAAAYLCIWGGNPYWLVPNEVGAIANQAGHPLLLVTEQRYWQGKKAVEILDPEPDWHGSTFEPYPFAEGGLTVWVRSDLLDVWKNRAGDVADHYRKLASIELNRENKGVSP